MAAKQRTQNTGRWFLQGSVYNGWKPRPDSILWLSGRPGTGKTTLCSAIIEDLMVQRHDESLLAFFYFKFDQPGKDSLVSLLKSLLQQFAVQWSSAVDILKVSYRNHGNGLLSPQHNVLMNTLKKIVESAPFTYIVLDALDECKERDDLLEFLYQLSEWRLGKLNVLVTSRPEQAIKDSLVPLVTFSAELSGASVNDDILLFIRDRLEHDATIKRWPQSLKDYAETILVQGAQGMFRWVSCQLIALHQCLSPFMVKQTLNSLPKTLDKTYEHILLSIDLDPGWIHQVLTWLVFSIRPLFVDELSEVLTIEIVQDQAIIDKSKKLFDDSIITGIFSSLVTLRDTYRSSNVNKDGFDSQIGLAHASVKEYLISERIRDGNAAQFALESDSANETIARACLGYLARFDNASTLDSVVADYSLADYAAQFWTSHAKRISASRNSIKVTEAAANLLLNKHTFRNWIRLFDLDETSPKYGSGVGLGRTLPEPLPSALYYACIAGLCPLVQCLLDRGLDVNAQGGNLGSPLQGACTLGHYEVVELLLRRNADEDADGPNGPSIVAAAASGHDKVISLLLRRDYSTHTRKANYIAAINAAAQNGRMGVCKLLLNQGELRRAQISLADYLPSMVEELSEHSDLEALQLLFEGGSVPSVSYQGANPDPIAANQSFVTEAVLQAAARNAGSTEILSRFLDLGATPTKQVLAAAASNREHGAEAVKLVLKHGVFTTASEDVLISAASNYSQGEEIIRHLLNRFPHSLRTTKVLKAAARAGGLDILRMLLDPIVLDISISPEVMFAAASYGDADVMEFLLDYETDFPITEDFLIAVTQNHVKGHGILVTIIKRYGKIEVTEKLKDMTLISMDMWMLLQRAKNGWITAEQLPTQPGQ